MLQYALLWVFHLFLALKRFVASLLPRRQPQALRARRRKLPAHLAVLLCSEKNLKGNGLDVSEALESVRRLISWCQSTGITTLSVFDEAGLLLGAWESVQAMVEQTTMLDDIKIFRESQAPRITRSRLSYAIRFPPTPPKSTSASSSSILSLPDTPLFTKPLIGREHNDLCPTLVKLELAGSGQDDSAKRRQPSLVSQDPPTTPGPLTLYILSKETGKAQLAKVTREIAISDMAASGQLKDRSKGNTLLDDTCSVAALTSRLEDPLKLDGWPCPDLLIIHTPPTSRKAQFSPPEFEGFPPWQIHLTEFTYIPPRLPQTDFLRKFWHVPTVYPGAVSEVAFRRALDEYDGAEMRFGK
ncbi:hypothetical protein CPB86DRAFT_744895 [Serendipita vermifera]|nr:hypothetical protein CPB86DRAFT_744895 [Serendipita vermifera]